jgi:hypothetical protein
MFSSQPASALEDGRIVVRHVKIARYNALEHKKYDGSCLTQQSLQHCRRTKRFTAVANEASVSMTNHAVLGSASSIHVRDTGMPFQFVFVVDVA